MFCDALTTASRPFEHPLPFPRRSYQIEHPLPFPRRSYQFEHFPTFDSLIAASIFSIADSLAHERWLAGGDEWTRSGNES